MALGQGCACACCPCRRGGAVCAGVWMRWVVFRERLGDEAGLRRCSHARQSDERGGGEEIDALISHSIATHAQSPTQPPERTRRHNLINDAGLHLASSRSHRLACRPHTPPLRFISLLPPLTSISSSSSVTHPRPLFPHPPRSLLLLSCLLPTSLRLHLPSPAETD